MRVARPSSLLAIVTILVSTYVFAPRAHGVTPAGTRGHTYLAAPPVVQDQYPSSTYTIAATYYSVRGNFTSQLTLNNKGAKVQSPRVTLYGRDGRRHTFTSILVPAASFIDVNIRDLTTAAGDGFEDGSIQVSYSGRMLEMGAQVRMSDSARGIGFDEQFTYPSLSKSNRLEAVWWIPRPTATARLVLTNTTGSQVDVTVRTEGHKGDHAEQVHLDPWALSVTSVSLENVHDDNLGSARFGSISVSYSGEPGGLLARGLVADSSSGYSAVVPFSDPAGVKTSSYQGSGLRLTSPGHARLEPVILASNSGNGPAFLSGDLRVSSNNGHSDVIALPTVNIPQGSAVAIDGQSAWDAALRMGASIVGVEFTYSGAPGSITISVSSVSRDLDQVYRVPLKDPAATESASGGYFWRIDDFSSTFVHLKNVSPSAQQYHGEIRFAGGSYGLGLRTLAP